MRQTLITLAFVALPSAAFACSVCFGQSDSPMAVATNMGIFFMLGVTICMLAAFASFFLYLMRRAKLAASSEQSAEPEPYLLRAEGPVLHASESRFFAPDPQRGTTRW